MRNWQNELKEAKSVQTDSEALDNMANQCKQALTCLQARQVLAGQAALEDTLAWTLLAPDRLQVDADQALSCVMARWQAHAGKKRFLVYPDFVEIWVGNEYRGGWPIQSDEDRNQVQKLAAELGRAIEACHSKQLSLLTANPV